MVFGIFFAWLVAIWNFFCKRWSFLFMKKTKQTLIRFAAGKDDNSLVSCIFKRTLKVSLLPVWPARPVFRPPGLHQLAYRTFGLPPIDQHISSFLLIVAFAFSLFFKQSTLVSGNHGSYRRPHGGWSGHLWKGKTFIALITTHNYTGWRQS